MIDGKPVNTTEQVAAIIEKAGGRQMCFRIRRGNITFDMYFSCVKSVNENCYKAGLWVRDSSAGIGTMTFYIPGSNVFGGLGHAICDMIRANRAAGERRNRAGADLQHNKRAERRAGRAARWLSWGLSAICQSTVRPGYTAY